jgi:hypothetical protein
MLLLLGIATALPFLACLALLPRTRATASFVRRFLGAIGLCTLCCTPAILVQDVLLATGWSATSFDPLEYLRMWPFQLWVLAGGGIVQFVFEASAKAISGHRQSTMIDNWPIYFAFTLAWVLPWSALLAARLRQRPWRRDVLAWCVAIVLLGNALAGVHWPWWGT